MLKIVLYYDKMIDAKNCVILMIGFRWSCIDDNAHYDDNAHDDKYEEEDDDNANSYFNDDNIIRPRQHAL